MIGRALACAAVAAVLAAPAVAQDSFGAPPQQRQPQQQGGMPQASQQGLAPQPSLPPTPAPDASALDRLAQLERQDFGVPPTNHLHPGPMHGPTPASIPGGQVVTTKGLLSLIQGRQTPFVLLDVLGGPETIPGSVPAAPAHQPGRLDDRIQQEFGAFLAQVTGGNREIPLVVYCLSNHCWMSYNAALRAINLGYTNVLWYRSGLEAWQASGQATQPTQLGYGQLTR